MQEFKCLGFKIEGKMESEANRWIGAVTAVMWTLYWTIVGKRELGRKAKLSTYQMVMVMRFWE